ncbi:MAG: ribokinase [Polyangiaceae bacterium]
MNDVLVIGSLNCDLVMRGPRRPRKGETVMGTAFDVFVGGKGNNQAIAAARAGARVSMIGRVGTDGFGDTLLAMLRETGVDTAGVSRDPEVSTGVADIFVDEQGDNSICVAPQANGRLTPSLVEASAALFERRPVVLLQLEIPLDAVECAVRLARAAGCPIILNPAPAPTAGALDHLLSNLDVLVPNETELAALTGKSSDDPESGVEELLNRGVGSVVATLGSRGAWLREKGHIGTMIPSHAVEVVDTTAAGDAFAGAFAARLAAGDDLRAAARWGVAAGALACTRLGAEPSLPHLTALRALLGDD